MTIHRSSIEIIAAEACNMRCAGCSHASPVIYKRPQPTAEIEADVQKLAQVYHADEVRVLGGEPLLRRDLEDLFKALRRTGIADQYILVTNGILLYRAKPSLLQQVDEVRISLYPSSRDRVDIPALRERSEKEGWRLEVAQFDRFRIPFSRKSSQNPALTQQIYETCQLAHVWHCHTVQDGRLYKCPQSIALAEQHNIPLDAISVDLAAKGNLLKEVEAFLADPAPIPACDFCAGSAGKLYDHDITDRDMWIDWLPLELEEAIDYDFLAELEQNPNLWSGCPTSLP